MKRAQSRETGAARGRPHEAGPGSGEWKQRALLTDVPVATIMSRPVVSVPSTDTLDRTLHRFAAVGLHHLVVIDHGGRCVGLLSDRVLAAAWAHNPMSFDRVTVASIIDSAPPLIRMDATVSSAARAMRHCGTDATVVVDEEGRPRGVLTAGDIIALLARPHR